MVDWFSIGIVAMVLVFMKGAALLFYMYAEEFYFDGAPQVWQYIALGLGLTGVSVVVEELLAGTSYGYIGTALVAVSSLFLAGSFWRVFKRAGGDIL